MYIARIELLTMYEQILEQISTYIKYDQSSPYPSFLWTLLLLYFFRITNLYVKKNKNWAYTSIIIQQIADLSVALSTVSPRPMNVPDLAGAFLGESRSTTLIDPMICRRTSLINVCTGSKTNEHNVFFWHLFWQPKQFHVFLFT